MNPILEQLAAWAQANLGLVVALTAGWALVLTVVAGRQAVALRRARAHYAGLAAGVDGENLEGLLDSHLRRLQQARGELDGLRAELHSLRAQTGRCVQHVGLVRYDAFETVGGQVSFTLALLDEHGDGVLITSIFARESSALYGKPIRGGQAAVPLTDEEREALRQALGSAARASRPR